MDNRITFSVANGVADVRLNRPDKLNALDPAMFEAIAAIGERLAQDRRVRAVVLSGEGKAFCAGLDMERLVATTEGESILPFADLGQRTHGITNWAQHLVWLWRELPMPVIAAVHGVALGGGFQLALGADIRYVAPDARLGIIEANWGLVPDMAGTQLMRHLAREDIIRELTFTARIFAAEDALAYGFATRIENNPREAALETARIIADRSPDAIRAAKRLLNRVADRDAAAGLEAETMAQKALLGSPNHVEAVRAHLDRRTPKWSLA
ncbi:crotonase/enoyl-CoA hydratase family protein [Bradyrhizobium jicamae]|uniref:Crotonase/enoyl-CoA hydratase family protein n=1 Tax=Bradyrhizobium jicamae TaxID=280332 RepID=A0ABS5FL30_9BRAD|nr:crotonase/enoyl-CoA hydratase family protein [Bradyrhizobium jicamae]MBR0797492.1 crotonase/enoyl-CoA hydratase family protein [Bradyrhizobium jicamae]MBR0935223.1 crotonase/enoyl-CoA hydratase family protein [Bradyrhizobium jicamae]